MPLSHTPIPDWPCSEAQEPLMQHLNLAHLRQISEGNAEFEQELLQLFVEDSFAHLAALKQAVAVSNFRQIAQSAHHLKGSGANVGAVAVRAIAADLEKQAQQKILESNHSLAALEHSLRQIQVWLCSRG